MTSGTNHLCVFFSTFPKKCFLGSFSWMGYTEKVHRAKLQYWNGCKNNIGRFFGSKSNFKLFRFRPIVISMISLYKLNTRGAGPISYRKFWNFGTAFCWYRHSTCHYGLPLAHFLVVLVQPSIQNHFQELTWWTSKSVMEEEKKVPMQRFTREGYHSQDIDKLVMSPITRRK